MCMFIFTLMKEQESRLQVAVLPGLHMSVRYLCQLHSIGQLYYLSSSRRVPYLFFNATFLSGHNTVTTERDI